VADSQDNPEPFSTDWCLDHGAPVRNEFGDIVNQQLLAERAERRRQGQS
jgi:hypothetical protein